MLVNQIINVDEDFDSGEVTEPVTLPQVKNYLRLAGFVSDTSGEQEFDFDDDILTAMITEARMWVEKFTGQYIVPRSLTVVLLNQAGFTELPGPVVGTVSFADADDSGIDPTDYKIIGTVFPKLETKFPCRLTATYEVGYTDFPKWVSDSVLAYIAFAYENRGDDNTLPGSPVRAAAIARPYRKVKAWG